MALHFAVRAGADRCRQGSAEARRDAARHDVGWDGRAGAGDCEHTLSSSRTGCWNRAPIRMPPDRGGRRCTRLPTHDGRTPASTTPGSCRGTSWTVLTLARKLLARGANPNLQATKNPDVTSVGTEAAVGGRRNAVLGGGADAGPSIHEAPAGARRQSADGEQHRRHAAAGRLRTRHREAGRESRQPRGSRGGGEVPSRTRSGCHDRGPRRQHGASRRRDLGLERRGRDARESRREARREEQAGTDAMAHRRGRGLRGRRARAARRPPRCSGN